MNLPEEAVIVKTGIAVVEGEFYALVRFRVPTQGGYDRPPHDDAIRRHKTREAAERWISDKIGDREVLPGAFDLEDE